MGAGNFFASHVLNFAIYPIAIIALHKNVMTKSHNKKTEEPIAIGLLPCFADRPYRHVVFDRIDQNKAPVYFVAGVEGSSMSAKKALKTAFTKHGGMCFYCKKEILPNEFTIDHADPVSIAGDDNIQNLLAAHKKCNQGKGSMPIEDFDSGAGREWLTAVVRQIEARLNRIR